MTAVSTRRTARAEQIPEPPEDLTVSEQVDWVIAWIAEHSEVRLSFSAIEPFSPNACAIPQPPLP